MPDSITLALAFYRAPFEHQQLLMPQFVLPSDTEQLLRIAGSAIQENSDGHAEDDKELHEAAIFFIQQVFFIRNATHYRVLGLNPGVDKDRIKEHHRLLIRLFHPDRQYSREGWAEVYAERVNEAYNVLRKPQSRQSYDYTLATQQQASPSVSAAASAFTAKPVDLSGPTGGIRLPRFLQRNLQQVLLGGSALLAVLFVFSVYLSNHSTSWYGLLVTALHTTPAPSDLSIGTPDKVNLPTPVPRQLAMSTPGQKSPELFDDVAKAPSMATLHTLGDSGEVILMTDLQTAGVQQNDVRKTPVKAEKSSEIERLMNSGPVMTPMRPETAIQRQRAVEVTATGYTASRKPDVRTLPDIGKSISEPVGGHDPKPLQPKSKPVGNISEIIREQNEPAAQQHKPSTSPGRTIVKAVEAKPDKPVAVADHVDRPKKSDSHKVIAEAKSEQVPVPVPVPVPVTVTQTEPPSGKTAELALAKPAPDALSGSSQKFSHKTKYTEVSGIELEVLTSLFVGAYERGNVEELMTLFDEQARANNKKGKSDIRKDYESFFGNTRSREILLRHLRWQRDGRSASGLGLYQVRIQNDQGTKNYSGTIRFEVRKKDKRVVITKLTHKALF